MLINLYENMHREKHGLPGGSIVRNATQIIHHNDVGKKM